MRLMSALKEKAQGIVARLPEDATWNDLVYEIQVRQKIEEGLKDLDEGRHTPHEKVRERFLGR
jgi:predicted transcriptional regulator